MKKAVKTLGIVVISAVILSCRNNSGNNPAEGTKDTVANAAPSAAQVVEQSETQQIDTLAVFDTINGMLKSLKEEQLWSKEIFTPAYYEVCQKLNEFSDGDSLWELGSIQEVMSVELTDVTEFKMLDPTHAEAEAMLECKDIDKTRYKPLLNTRHHPNNIWRVSTIFSGHTSLWLCCLAVLSGLLCEPVESSSG